MRNTKAYDSYRRNSILHAIQALIDDDIRGLAIRHRVYRATHENVDTVKTGVPRTGWIELFSTMSWGQSIKWSLKSDGRMV